MLRTSVFHICFIQRLQASNEKEQICTQCLIPELVLHIVCGFQQFQCLFISTDHQIAKVIGPPRDKMMGIKAFCHDVIKQQHGSWDVT